MRVELSSKRPNSVNATVCSQSRRAEAEQPSSKGSLFQKEPGCTLGCTVPEEQPDPKGIRSKAEQHIFRAARAQVSKVYSQMHKAWTRRDCSLQVDPEYSLESCKLQWGRNARIQEKLTLKCQSLQEAVISMRLVGAAPVCLSASEWLVVFSGSPNMLTLTTTKKKIS